MDLEQKFHEALAAYQAQKWPEARQSFQNIIQAHPDCKEAWFQLGVMEQHEGHLSAAIDCFEKVMELDPQIQEVYFHLGQIAIQQQQASMALGYWGRALDINPAYAEAHLQSAMVRLQMGDENTAQQHIEVLLKNAPEHKQALFFQARDFLLRGQHREAELIASVLKKDDSALLMLSQLAALKNDSPTSLKYLSALTQPSGEALQALFADRDDYPESFLSPYRDLLAWLPRCPQWYHNQQSHAINRRLLQAAEWPPSAPRTQVNPGGQRKIVWVIDVHVLPWQDWVWSYLSALPMKHWEIELALRTHSLQALLRVPEHLRRLRIHTLPEALSAAGLQLNQAAADVILWSSPELDSLQFWLSRQQLAPLQLAVPESPRADDSPFSEDPALQISPYLELLPNSSVAQPQNAPELLCPITPWGLSEKEFEVLNSTEHPVHLLAHRDQLSAVQAVHERLKHLNLGFWHWGPDLIELISQAHAVLLPTLGQGPYAALAQRLERPCFALTALPEKFETPPALPHLQPQLPHTQWAVDLWDTLHTHTRQHKESSQ